jgi:hypothetical protein
MTDGRSKQPQAVLKTTSKKKIGHFSRRLGNKQLAFSTPVPKRLSVS